MKIANQYEGIWDYTDTDVIRLERELEQLSVEEELYEDLVVKIKWVNGSALERSMWLKLLYFRTAHGQTIEDITICNNEANSYALAEEKCIEECVKATESLQEINIANQKKIQELSQLYMKAQKFPLFIHQMSIDQYLQKCDLFVKRAEVYMQKNFKVQVSSCVRLRSTHI